MGRSAGQEARVAGGDRAVVGQRPALEAVKGVKPAAPKTPTPPTPPRALATAPASVAPAPLAAKSASAGPPPLPAAMAAPAPAALVAAAPATPAAPPASATPAAPAATNPARPRTGAECKTVREILPPWHVLQEKLQNKTAGIATRDEALNQDAQQALQAQEAANAMWMPPSAPASSRTTSRSPSNEPRAHTAEDSVDVPPSSGVRMSEPHAAVAGAHTPAEGPDSLLSFKVYTLAELERRSDAPISMRASRVNFDSTSSRSSQHWQRAFVALKAFATASIAWLKIKGERPNVKVALRQPFDNLGDELQVAVESVDWKKLGVTTGIVVGATLTLLFAVLTAAELTDDLKPPGSAAHLASAETGNASSLPSRAAFDTRGVAPATNMAAMGVQPIEPAPVVIAPPAPAVTAIGEVDELAETPSPVAKKKKAAAATAKPKSNGNKLTLRSAPF